MTHRSALLAVGLFGSLSFSPAVAMPGDPAREVALAAADVLARDYVFPTRGAAAAEALRRRAASGAYDGETGEALAAVLTSDLAVLGDRHVRVDFSTQTLPPSSAADDAPSPDERAGMARFDRSIGYGIGRVVHLPGNVGYLDVRGFAGSAPQRDYVIDAAVDTIAYSDAVVLDLRRNRGGDPDAVARLLSHFLPPHTHLNDFVGRGDDATKIVGSTFTARTRGPLVAAPIYVLTSAETFSGGEECAYDLQALRRATLVGETTGGGANPGVGHRIADHFSIFVPDERARNPITHANWEGTGVRPDLAVAHDLALRAAYATILERRSADGSATTYERDQARELRERVRTMDDDGILSL